MILSFLPHIMGNKTAEFDGLKFGYLGGPSPYDTVCTFNNETIGRMVVCQRAPAIYRYRFMIP